MLQEAKLLDDTITTLTFQYTNPTLLTGSTGDLQLTGNSNDTQLTILIETKEPRSGSQRHTIEEWIRIRIQDTYALISWSGIEQ